MSKKTNKTIEGVAAEGPNPEGISTGDTDCLSTAQRAGVVAPEKSASGQNAPEENTPGQGNDQGQGPPYAAMEIDPAAVLSFAQRDGIWVVVTTDGQKHHWPAGV